MNSENTYSSLAPIIKEYKSKIYDVDQLRDQVKARMDGLDSADCLDAAKLILESQLLLAVEKLRYEILEDFFSACSNCHLNIVKGSQIQRFEAYQKMMQAAKKTTLKSRIVDYFKRRLRKISL